MGWKPRKSGVSSLAKLPGKPNEAWKTLLKIYDSFYPAPTKRLPMSDQPDPQHQDELGILEAIPQLKRPPLFKVLLLNDDFTPMEFVVQVLKCFFGMNEEKATQVMLHVHTRGIGVCGVFSRDVAETKVRLVNDYARQHQHPLLCAMEET
jgi:ATP-dependent Clp protease adaptor protein ClpS